MASPPTPLQNDSPRTRRWRWGVLVVILIAVGAGAAIWARSLFLSKPPQPPENSTTEMPAVEEGPAWFRDVTRDTGIHFIHKNGEDADEFTILESLGGGVALFDYDNDGLLDLFFTGGGYFAGKTIKGLPCKLYKNLGNWKFKDVTAEVGLDKIDFYSHGVAVADFDRDGFPDLLVTGYRRLALFRNQDGKRFLDVTDKSGLKPDNPWGTSAAFADLGRTGYPDLYVCNYVDWSFTNHPQCQGKGNVKRDVCPPEQFKTFVHGLYRNNGNGTFRDVASEQKLRSDGAGLGVVMADFTGDGRPSIYVANDGIGNHFYVTRAENQLEEIALAAGVRTDDAGQPQGSMGVDVADYDGSGRPSIFVVNFQNQLYTLYQNLGRERFVNQSRSVGMAALKRDNVGFGASFLDVDNDGWEDLIATNGHVVRFPAGASFKQKPVLLRNMSYKDRRLFVDWSKRGGSFFDIPTLGRGLAVGDLDNDGWPDVVVSHTNSPAVVLRNHAFEGSSNRWLGVELIGKKFRDVTGSTLRLKTDTRTLTRFSKSGGSYLSASDRRILFGLSATDKPGRLTVRWAWGEEQHFDNLEAGAYWRLREGEPSAERITYPARK